MAGEMIVQDRALLVWLPLGNGWARAVPAALALVIGALGWWFDHRARTEAGASA